MKLYRFMSLEEFQSYLRGDKIEGRFVKGKACFLEENIPARKKTDKIKYLTDLPLKFESQDFEGQMNELTKLLLDNFRDGDFDGALEEFESLTLSDFMSRVREGAAAEVLVEFETMDNAEHEFDRVIRAYRDFLIEEIQADAYSDKTLRCLSYIIDLENEFKNGVGVNTIPKIEFSNPQEALKQIESQTKREDKLGDFSIRKMVQESIGSGVTRADIGDALEHEAQLREGVDR